MNRTSRILAAAAALALSGTTVATAATFGPGTGPNSASTTCSVGSECPRTATDPAPAELTAQQAYDIAYSREEERMARDLYRAFADAYDGGRPFGNISESEQRHFDAMGRLIDRYGISDPSAGKPAGTYAFPSLQKHYDAWLEQGLRSRVEAGNAGADLERADIKTLEEALELGPPSDVETVYENLLAASHNHLAAFTRVASGQGGRQGKAQGARDGSGKGRGAGQARGGGQGEQDGTGPRAGTQDCPRAS